VFLAGTTLFSEAVFAALTTAALLMLRRIELRGAPSLYVCLTGLVIGMALLTRTTGLALLAAGILALAYKRSFRHAILLTLSAATLYAPWVWWTSAHPYSGRRMEAYYTSENYRAWNVAFAFAPSEKLAVVWGNLLHLAGSPLSLLQAPLALWAVLLAPAGIGMGYGLFRAIAGQRSKAIPAFLVCYLGLLVLWAWPPERFVATVFPLVLFLYWVAAEKVRGKAWLRWFLAVAALFAAAYVGGTWYGICRRVIANGTYMDDNRTALRAMTAWIARSTPRNAVLVSRLDPVIYLYADRKGLRGSISIPSRCFTRSTKATRQSRRPK
jgi:4-amino-4-deoxy-L-arabinose transferase-like glycosyltransferase